MATGDPHIAALLYWMASYVVIAQELGSGDEWYKQYVSDHHLGVGLRQGACAGHGPSLLAAAASSLRDSCVDVAFATVGLFIFPATVGLLREWTSVHKLNGKIVMFDYNRRVDRWLSHKNPSRIGTSSNPGNWLNGGARLASLPPSRECVPRLFPELGFGSLATLLRRAMCSVSNWSGFSGAKGA